MDAASWPQVLQGINKLVSPMEDISSNSYTGPTLERKARPQEQLNCPRCSSTNTKFCYYNNYSLSQPRYFCKTCRRYWTEGGSLRNVPVGGGSRKNKRSITSTSASSSKLPDLNPPNLSQFSPQNVKDHQGQDLNLSFPVEDSSQGTTLFHYLEVPKSATERNQHNSSTSSSSSSSCSTSSPLSALELLRTGIASRGLNSSIPTLMPDSNTLYSSGFPLQEFKPSLSFSVDGLGSRYGVQENGGKTFFPFGDLKQLSSTPSSNGGDHQNRGQGTTSSGFWNNGMLGGGSW